MDFAMPLLDRAQPVFLVRGEQVFRSDGGAPYVEITTAEYRAYLQTVGMDYEYITPEHPEWDELTADDD